MTHIRHRRRPVFTLRYRIGNEKPKRTRKERREASEDHQRRLRSPYRTPYRPPEWKRERNGWHLVHYFDSGYAWVGYGVKVSVYRKDLPCPWSAWPDLPAEQQAPIIAMIQAERLLHHAAMRAAPPPGPFKDIIFPTIRARFNTNPIRDLVGVEPASSPRQHNTRSRYSNAPA